MKKIQNLLLTGAFALIATFAFSQIKVVAPDGDVGIGESNPQGKLHVSGPDVNVRIQDVGGTGRAGFTCQNSAQAWKFFIGATNGFKIRDNVAGSNVVDIEEGGPSNALRIDAIGNVGMGTYAPTEKLQVAGNIMASGGLVLTSDKRLKKNENSFKYGLDEVLQLNPITYEYNGKGGTIDGNKHIGLYAQDLQKVVPSLVKEFTHKEFDEDNVGNQILRSSENFLAIKDSEIKYLLINAIKDQQSIIEDQKSEINTLEERLETLESLVSTILEKGTASTDVELNSNNKAELAQNQPNPFDGNTLIKYTLPENTDYASMQIMDMSGRVLKTIQLDASISNGEVNVKAGQLNAGSYTYSLIINGDLVDTKKMVLTK